MRGTFSRQTRVHTTCVNWRLVDFCLAFLAAPMSIVQEKKLNNFTSLKLIRGVMVNKMYGVINNYF
jgi:hypothetical protein